MIAHSTDWREVIGPDEQAKFEGFAQELKAIGKRYAERKGAPVGRALHLKTHTGAVGTLRVFPQLPPPLSSGVFAAERSWPVYVRFSNGSGKRQKDPALDVRGLAVKLVGVPGPKIIPGLEDKLTQDFLFIQAPCVPTNSPDEFLALVRAGEHGAQMPLRFAMAVGPLRAAKILFGFTRMPVVESMATSRFFTAVPLKYGAAAAKLELVPEGSRTPRKGESLRDDIVDRLRSGTVAYRVRAQLFQSEKKTPIEDASREWREEDAPFHEIGVLELPRQDPEGERGKEIEALVEKLSFDPWHAVQDHRPLGATQRARAAAYRESVIQRGAAPEPDSVLAPTI